MKRLKYKELLEQINNIQREQEKAITDIASIEITNAHNLTNFEQSGNKTAVRALTKIAKILFNELKRTIDNYIDNFTVDAFESFCVLNGLESVYERYMFLTEKGGEENE